MEIHEQQPALAAFCHGCGTRVADGAAFCHACGENLAISPAANEVRESAQGVAPPLVYEEPAPRVAMTATPQLFTYSAPSTAERMRFATRASFGRRVAGFVIDLVVIIVLWFTLCGLVMLPMSADQRGGSGAGGAYIGMLALAFIVYEWASASFAGTLGMRALGMRIVPVGGRRLTATTRLVRTMVLFGGGMIVVGLFSGLWHPEGRTWHDLASGTGVVSLGSGAGTPG